MTLYSTTSRQETMHGCIPWWFFTIPLCHLCCPHFQMSRSNEPVIAFCHPVSTRAQLPPGSDVQGHRLKPYTCLPRPSNQLSQGLGGGVLLGFLLWLPLRSLNFTRLQFVVCEADLIAPRLCLDIASDAVYRPAPGWEQEATVEKIRQAVEFLHHPGSSTVACSVQM